MFDRALDLRFEVTSSFLQDIWVLRVKNKKNKKFKAHNIKYAGSFKLKAVYDTICMTLMRFMTTFIYLTLS